MCSIRLTDAFPLRSHVFSNLNTKTKREEKTELDTPAQLFTLDLHKNSYEKSTICHSQSAAGQEMRPQRLGIST